MLELQGGIVFIGGVLVDHSEIVGKRLGLIRIQWLVE